MRFLGVQVQEMLIYNWCQNNKFENANGADNGVRLALLRGRVLAGLGCAAADVLPHPVEMAVVLRAGQALNAEVVAEQRQALANLLQAAAPIRLEPIQTGLVAVNKPAQVRVERAALFGEGAHGIVVLWPEPIRNTGGLELLKFDPIKDEHVGRQRSARVTVDMMRWVVAL